MGDIPVPFGPPTPAVSEAIDRFLDTRVRCQCAGRDIRVSCMRIQQEIQARIWNNFLELFPVDPLSLNSNKIYKGTWYTGSYAEGLPLSVVGDYDVMYSQHSWPDIVLTSNPDHSVSYQAGYLIATQSNRNNPAYLTLEVPPSVTLNPDFKQFIIIIEEMSEGRSRNVVSSELFVKGSHLEGWTRQGPAFNTQERVASHDKVPCLVSPSWPHCASDFLIRTRSYDWPGRKLIDRIKNAGCHAVAIGHPQSDNKEIEWRWSFSMAEKELIYDMSDMSDIHDMYGCIYVLKAIKKHHWRCNDSDKTTTFCSYYIKTACLWVCETEPHNVNVMELCRKVLAWLIFWYRTNTLPHYFIPNQNLIGHLSKDMCKEVYDWLLYIRSDLWYIVIFSDIVPEITNVMGNVLTGRTISTRDLVITLCLHKQTQQILEQIEQRLEPLSKFQKLIATHQCACTAFEFFFIFNMFSPSGIFVLYPNFKLFFGESVYLPVIENIADLVTGEGRRMYDTKSIIKMFTTFQYRHLGDYYLYMSVDASLDEKGKYIDKAVKYYTMGKQLVHTDGWGDKGLGGDILLARLYYLNCQWDLLKSILNVFLKNANSVSYDFDLVNFSPYIVYPFQYEEITGSMAVWQIDRELFNALKMRPHAVQLTYIHSVSLGYYMVCRSAHREEDKAKIEWALGKLVSISSEISSWRFWDNDFTRELILIITRLPLITE